MKILAKLILMIFCLSLFALDNYSQNKKKSDEEFKKFDDFYNASLKKYGIFGSSFAMIHDNKIVDKQFYGMAHVANNYKVDEDTIYHWASISKTLTGIAIMQLRDRGKLKLEDSITKYVPELRQIHNPFG